jgi:hypothetical protein
MSRTPMGYKTRLELFIWPHSFLSSYSVIVTLTALITAVGLALIELTPLRINYDSVGSSLRVIGGPIGIALFLLFVSKIERYQRVTKELRYDEAFMGIAWASLTFIVACVFTLLQYICTSLKSPLIDQYLLNADYFFGFD